MKKTIRLPLTPSATFVNPENPDWMAEISYVYISGADKFKAFNFETVEINGHNFDEIRAAFEKAKQTKGKPTAIIMKTIKGKGVSYMEDNAGWHGKAPNDEEYAKAMDELNAAGEELKKAGA